MRNILHKLYDQCDVCHVETLKTDLVAGVCKGCRAKEEKDV